MGVLSSLMHGILLMNFQETGALSLGRTDRTSCSTNCYPEEECLDVTRKVQSSSLEPFPGNGYRIIGRAGNSDYTGSAIINIMAVKTLQLSAF